MKVAFELELPPVSEWGLNQVYAGRHWSVRKRQAEKVHILVRASIRRQCRNVKTFANPVHVRIFYNSRLDIDNHGYLAKLIIDGMKGVLIQDDSRQFVRSLYQGFHGGDRKTIFVEVEEV